MSNYIIVCSPEKGVDLDCHSVEFGDVRYHIQVILNGKDFIYLILEFKDAPFGNIFGVDESSGGSQISMKKPQVMVLSVSLPIPPPEAIFHSGLPVGAIEAIKVAYGPIVQILDPPKDGYNLTMKLYLSKLPSDEGSASFLSKVIMSFCHEWVET